MTDWQALTGDALNWHVAERRGDAVRHAETDADGFVDEAFSADAGWLDHWIEDADGNAHPVPDVAGSADEALKLVPTGLADYLFTLEKADDGPWEAGIGVDMGFYERTWFYCEAETPALAITYAWCAAMDAKENR